MLHGDVGTELGVRVAAALQAGLQVVVDPADTLIRPSTRAGVDYQCNVAMSLARTVGRPPRDVAEVIVSHLDSADLLDSTEIAGPGFVNLVLRREWLQQRATHLAGDQRVGAPVAETPRRIALDYSSPNVAKEMHVGHLRSSIIGDALSRLLTFAGHEVIPHNHLGDWGTPFGMLIEHLVDEGADADHSISDLSEFYQRARTKFDSDPEFTERSRRRVVLLQSGDPATLGLWHTLVEESGRHFEHVYQLLGIQLTAKDAYGESFYNPYLDDTVAELQARGLTVLSDGAVCVFPPGFTNRDGEPLPLIVRKRDGGYGYAATDLATIRYWVGERGVHELLYVVGSPQAQHFQMVFAVARQAGWLTDAQHAEHIGFGAVLGEGGKQIRTRVGGTVKLVDLLTEAVDRAAAIIVERSELDAAEQAQVARAVGIGSVKYADLSSDRDKDYVFSWPKMLAMDGNTAVYLQYANARILSIVRRAGSLPPAGTPVLLTEEAERALVLALLRWPAAVRAATESYRPHTLCGYLYELATAWSGFYERCHILSPDTPPDLRASRLVLAQTTSRTLTLGLALLGIEAPNRV